MTEVVTQNHSPSPPFFSIPSERSIQWPTNKIVTELGSLVEASAVKRATPESLDDLMQQHGRDVHHGLTQYGSHWARSNPTRQPKPVLVPRVGRDVAVKIASTREEWEGAFALVAENYQAKGYEGACQVRFTPYHALPDTVTFVAKKQRKILMTMTLVPDNTVLGLPMETIYTEEVSKLRRQRRRIAEVISLSADRTLKQREFLHVFLSIIRLMKQFHVASGGDTWVITVNPKHANFYTKYLGYEPLGPRRIYDQVGGHPAEAFVLDEQIMKSNAPKKHREMLQEWLPGEALITSRMPRQLLRYLSRKTGESSQRVIYESFDFDDFFDSPRRW
jgi:hypothetical protein